MENDDIAKNEDCVEREKLIHRIEELNAQIRKKVLNILVHPDTPEIFKNRFEVAEEVKWEPRLLVRKLDLG